MGFPEGGGGGGEWGWLALFSYLYNVDVVSIKLICTLWFKLIFRLKNFQTSLIFILPCLRLW